MSMSTRGDAAHGKPVPPSSRVGGVCVMCMCSLRTKHGEAIRTDTDVQAKVECEHKPTVRAACGVLRAAFCYAVLCCASAPSPARHELTRAVELHWRGTTAPADDGATSNRKRSYVLSTKRRGRAATRCEAGIRRYCHVEVMARLTPLVVARSVVVILDLLVLPPPSQSTERHLQQCRRRHLTQWQLRAYTNRISQSL
jgi:hypothetical protein